MKRLAVSSVDLETFSGNPRRVNDSVSSPFCDEGSIGIGVQRIRTQRNGRVVKKPNTLLILVHGLDGFAEDLAFVHSEVLAQQYRSQSRIMVYSSTVNEGKTHDGIVNGGERLSNEIMEVVRLNPEMEYISFIGFSLGGIYSRYACAKLFDPEMKTIAGLIPEKYVSVASPHVGVGSFGMYRLASRPVQELISYTLFGKTGNEMMLLDSNQVLLQMATDQPSWLPFRTALSAFRKRILYGNAQNDFVVPFGTATLQPNLQDLRLGDSFKPPSNAEIIDESHNIHGCRVWYEHDLEVYEPENNATETESAEIKISRQLRQLSWHVVAIDFPLQLPIAHNRIISLSRSRIESWLNSPGLRAVQHIVSTSLGIRDDSMRSSKPEQQQAANEEISTDLQKKETVVPTVASVSNEYAQSRSRLKLRRSLSEPGCNWNRMSEGRTTTSQGNVILQREADSIIFLVPGLEGMFDDVELVRVALAAGLVDSRQRNNVIHHTCEANIGRSLDGIRNAGSRLASEIEQVIQRHIFARKFSIIAFSIGALHARYALGLLAEGNNSQNVNLICGLQPEQFVSFCSPMLGLRSFGFYKLLSPQVQQTLAFSFLGTTGMELFLLDAGERTPPLLETMCSDEEVNSSGMETNGPLPFSRALQAFRSRIAFASYQNDWMVPFGSCTLQPSLSDIHFMKLGSGKPPVGAQSSVFDSAPPGESLYSVYEYSSEANENVAEEKLTSVEHKIARNLQRLGWQIVVVDPPISWTLGSQGPLPRFSLPRIDLVGLGISERVAKFLAAAVIPKDITKKRIQRTEEKILLHQRGFESIKPSQSTGLGELLNSK